MKKSPKHRTLRIADQIQRDLAQLIPQEIRDPAMGLVTLQSVELTPDLAHAKIYYSVLGASPEVCARIFKDKAGYLHSLLFKRLRTHTVPTLHFIHDQSIERGLEMSRLIDLAMQDTAPEKPKED